MGFNDGVSVITLALAPGAYLLGMFPSAAMVARASGVDITAEGSGNPGASNVSRVLGWKRGVLVFVLDAAKGAIAAGVGWTIDGRASAYICVGAAALGHMFPALRRFGSKRFAGGKGVATVGGCDVCAGANRVVDTARGVVRRQPAHQKGVGCVDRDHCLAPHRGGDRGHARLGDRRNGRVGCAGAW